MGRYGVGYSVPGDTSYKGSTSAVQSSLLLSWSGTRPAIRVPLCAPFSVLDIRRSYPTDRIVGVAVRCYEGDWLPLSGSLRYRGGLFPSGLQRYLLVWLSPVGGGVLSQPASWAPPSGGEHIICWEGKGLAISRRKIVITAFSHSTFIGVRSLATTLFHIHSVR